MKTKLLLSLSAFMLLTACAGKNVETVEIMQKKDKQLSCRQVKLEMNEADFQIEEARKSKGPNLKTVIMPLSYVSTYMSAEKAASAASARKSYLEKIAGIMDCSNGQADSEDIAPLAVSAQIPPQPAYPQAMPMPQAYPMPPYPMYGVPYPQPQPYPVPPVYQGQNWNYYPQH